MTKAFWETTYRQNIDKMIGICYRYIADKQIAEDLAHDGFLKAIEKSSGFEGKGHFDAWLRRIVVNVALQYLREQKKKIYFEDWIEHRSIVMESEDNNLNPIEEADFSENELLEVINSLAEHHRLVFNLYVVDKFTHAQIGEELGISAGTSKSHLARARKKIKVLLNLKAEEKQKKKRGFLFLLFPSKGWNVDKLYVNKFNNFGLQAQKQLSFDTLDFSVAAVPKFKPLLFTLKNFSKAAVAVGVISSTIYFTTSFSNPQKGISYTETEIIRVAIQNERGEPMEVEGNNEELNSEENTLGTRNRVDKSSEILNSDSLTATILSDSIILNENNKNESMKSLNSIAALLAASSLVLDSVAHQKNKPIERLSNLENKVLVQESSPVTIPLVETEETGYFYADRIFWSEEDNEVYFKGKVTIRFGSNNLKGNGSVNFLKKVHLLMINGTSVDLGSTTRLTNKKYDLRKLTSEDAVKKYGQKGKQGAVEILVSN